MEPYLAKGKPTYHFEPEVKDSSVRTLALWEQLLDYKIKSEKEKCDVARSFVHCLLKELTRMALEKAGKEAIPYLGISGGVSYNTPIVSMVGSFVKAGGKRFLTHHAIPNGDGGISVGQNAIAGWKSLS